MYILIFKKDNSRPKILKPTAGKENSPVQKIDFFCTGELIVLYRRMQSFVQDIKMLYRRIQNTSLEVKHYCKTNTIFIDTWMIQIVQTTGVFNMK